MVGKITIEASGKPGDIGIHVDVRGVDFFSKMLIFDALALALNLDKEERQIVGMIVGCGGLSELLGEKPTTVAVDVGAIRKAREKLNETD